KEFRANLRDWAGTVFNFVYADSKGNVGYQMAGRVPVRGRVTHGLRDANNPQVNGRRYCSECTQNRAEQRHIAPIYQKILRVYATYGFGDVLPNVPVVLTDSDTLNRKTGGPALPTQSAALGLTETTTTGPYHRYTIYMLYGLPLLEFEAVLAHELLHTWLHEHDVEMSQPEVEGFCNIGAYMLLTNARNKHGEILKQDMVANPDPVYGEGFMKMLRMVQREGWLPFIAYIKARKRKHGWGWFS
ncbi:MAG: protein DA1, partial [Chitinophagia bacterium]|nr:protein DA1 [Chitinophagia bacterium]